MKVGDRVKILKVPPGVRNTAKMKTRDVFELCVGHTYTIRGFQEDWLELDVGRTTGNRFETIWIEPNCVKRVPRGKR